jgi:hypothetical protein
MGKFQSLYIVLFFICNGVYGQLYVKISDVSFRLDNNRIVIVYNLEKGPTKEEFNIGLKFVTDNNMVIIPESVSGDVGNNIKAGKGKTIYWNFDKDNLEFEGNLKAVVTATPIILHSGGPGYALLSVAVPGLGDHFVDDNRVLPMVTTIGTLGLMTFGIIEKTQANKYYADYKQGASEEEILSLYDKANSAHHLYYLSTRIAAAAWIADIVWVYIKGKRNLSKSGPGNISSSGRGFTLNCIDSGIQFGYRLSF